MSVDVHLVDHPLVAVTIRGLRPRTPSASGSLAVARPHGDTREGTRS